MKIYCQHCERYQFTATGNVMIEQMPCVGCGAKNNYKIILSDSAPALTYTPQADEEPPKKLKKSL